jgi:signal transduction histidine kinase/ActR/RegA family two-component response regulator
VTDLAGLRLLRRIEEGVAGKSGEAFFREIVRELTLALHAHAAFTSRLLPERRARMLAFWVDGRYEKCLEYSLAGTPCEFVYNGRITAFGRDIGSVFPVDRAWFEELGVHSYLGVPIVSESGEVHGHLAVMDRPERDWRDADVDILRLFSLRTAVELERENAHRMLQESNESLRRMNDQLNHEIARRIEMERQLATAKLAAEAANQAKSTFISQMSHELRTPLNGILGYAQLLRRSPQSLTEQQLDGLATIERSGEHLLNLVNDLLDLAKIEAGRLELRDEPVDLQALIHHVVDLIRVRADKAGLTFVAELASALPRIHGDARALRQVLLNLLGNAVKFTRPGGSITLRIGHEPTLSQPRFVFEIEDSGIGMPADQLHRIFEPFHRIEDANRPAEGTGLGLAITRRLVEAMRGSIDVESEPGHGTTFRVQLDLQADAIAAEAPTERRHIIGYSGPRRSVLVVDDDPVNRALVADLLASLGFNVRRAIDGRDAFEQIRREPVDLVVTDLVMPRLDGMELIETIRADEVLAGTRILAVSASASEYTGQEATEAGSDAFLTKPLHLPALLDRVAELLRLQWEYGQSGSDGRRPATVPGEFSLERKLADELYHLAMLGDINGLVERATQLLGADPCAEPFCDELRSLASQYDTGAIRRMLSVHTPG